MLCIIEAMKLMNEIDSEYDGEIVNIYVESGQPVQYGERLVCDTDGSSLADGCEPAKARVTKQPAISDARLRLTCSKRS